MSAQGMAPATASNAVLRAISAEVLKLRGTLALWMCLIAPATVALLYMLQMVVMDYGKRPTMPPDDAWKMYAPAGISRHSTSIDSATRPARASDLAR